MKKINFFLFLLAALFLVQPQGVNSQGFRHPGGLVSQSDIDRIIYLLNTEKDPTIVAAFDKLKANGHSQYTNTPTPTSSVIRGGTSDNYSVAYHQAAAAFQNAFMWRITSDNRYADCAVRILNAWAVTCKEIEGNSNASLAAGIYGYEFAQAGELLRGYSGWKADDFKVFQNWMRNMWAVRSLYFLDLRHGQTTANNNAIHYWSNWGLCNVMCVMSVGLLCDDVALYNEGLSHYKTDLAGNYTEVYSNPIHGIGYAEFLGNLVVWLQPDSRGPYGFIGQMQESGRDQGHATMALGLAVDICQTAWNQGEDLYGHMNNRLAAGIEYIALHNSLQPKTDPADSLAYMQELRDSVPFLPYEREGWIMTENGAGMGATRPYWDRVVAHYEGEMGVPMAYSRKMVLRAGIDGGGGDYGPNSGGFDHLGFSTLTNYRPKSLYPAAGHFPVNLDASIRYNGLTVKGNALSGVRKDSMFTLIPTLPEGMAEDGTWKWSTGATTRELTVQADKSTIYRVTYTSPNGTKSRNTFDIAVWGDCSPEKIYYGVTVLDTVYNDTVVNVLPFQKFTLSINTRYNERGTAVWNTGAAGFSLPVTYGIRKDSTFWVDHYNRGGYKTRIVFHVKMKVITPSISVAGAVADPTSNVVVAAGKDVELIPVTTLGFDTGTFRWSTGHTSKNLFVLNIQRGCSFTVRYTLVKNGVTYLDSIRYKISVVNHNFQLPNGDYFIRKAADSTYLTNTNLTSTTKIAPTFGTTGDAVSRTWTITKETNSLASGRFKIVSKKDGNYLSENCTFGTNAYYPEWNTYTLHVLDGENLYAIQNGGKAGTLYWTINANTVTGKGSATQNGYPFLIMPVVPQPVNPVQVPGEGVASYIAPSYSITGVPAQRGDTVIVTQGKNLTLAPVKVFGLTGGTWRWGDNSTGSTLSLNNVQTGGNYPVTFTYPEGDSTYVFTFTYVVKVVPATGINNVVSSLATVYPNPVSDHLVVKVSENTASNSTFGLYTIDGLKLKSLECISGENKMNISNVPHGLYIGILNQDGNSQMFKIMKK
ncbi:MAG TPA: alginate lyase family protein [Paludibacter sp.]|nr:alginate lyase family protein [Paludibacter sp.]